MVAELGDGEPLQLIGGEVDDDAVDRCAGAVRDAGRERAVTSRERQRADIGAVELPRGEERAAVLEGEELRRQARGRPVGPDREHGHAVGLEGRGLLLVREPHLGAIDERRPLGWPNGYVYASSGAA